MKSNQVKIAVLQLNSYNDKLQNLKTIQQLFVQIKDQGVQMCFLPENFAQIGATDKSEYENIDGPFITEMKSLAREYKTWISLGGFVNWQGDYEKPFNSHIILDDEGVVRATYNKVHLFNIQHDQYLSVSESKVVQAGQQLHQPIDTPIGRLGLAVCYDLRFPELFRLQMQQGAQVLTVPAAFFKLTGDAHWHILLRARAIENQCFVIAAAQCGFHGPKRQSFGHSLVIDPWGKVLLDMGEEVGIQTVEIDLAEVEKIRNQLPSTSNIRHDLYKIQIQ